MTSSIAESREAEALGNGVEIRHVRTHAEFVSCVDLQVATWGAAFREVIPATMLKITQRLGGVTAGAFAADGALLGFIFGITGVEHGDIVHWSDMLAVRDAMQNQGIGRQLKVFQRDAVCAIGATRMYWTFDPLVARNAHFNLNRLGARVTEYVPDMYGADTGSVLHSGFGTDRFVVVWPIGGPPPAPGGSRSPHPIVPRPLAPSSNEIPILNAVTEGRDDDPSRFASSLPQQLRIAIPSDIFRVNAESVTRASHWRATTRRAFQWALESGYTVERFERHDTADRGFYVLARTPAHSAET